MVRTIVIMLGLTSPLVASAAEPGPYVGAGAGIWWVDEGLLEGEAAQARVHGGWTLNRFLAAEISAHRYFEVGGGSIGVDGDGVQIAVRPVLPLVDGVEGYARIGWGFYDFEASGFGVSVSETDDDFLWAVGATWETAPDLGVRFEFSSPHGGDSSVLTVGVTWYPRGF